MLGSRSRKSLRLSSACDDAPAPVGGVRACRPTVRATRRTVGNRVSVYTTSAVRWRRGLLRVLGRELIGEVHVGDAALDAEVQQLRARRDDGVEAGFGLASLGPGEQRLERGCGRHGGVRHLSLGHAELALAQEVQPEGGRGGRAVGRRTARPSAADVAGDVDVDGRGRLRGGAAGRAAAGGEQGGAGDDDDGRDDDDQREQAADAGRGATGHRAPRVGVDWGRTFDAPAVASCPYARARRAAGGRAAGPCCGPC